MSENPANRDPEVVGGGEDQGRLDVQSPMPPLESDDAPLVDNEETPAVAPGPGEEASVDAEVAAAAAAQNEEIVVDGLEWYRHREPINREDLLPLSEKYDDFQPMPTIPAATVSIVLSLGMIASVFAVPIFCTSLKDHAGSAEVAMTAGHDDDKKMCPVQAFSLLIYVHSVYWVIHLIIDPYLKAKHKANRIAGYLEFYLSTKNIRRAPFYLVSVGNFCLLLASTVLNDFCETYPGSCDHRFMKVDWLRGLITVEAMVNLLLFAFYIMKIKEFNRHRPFPDCMRPEYMNALGSNLTLKFPKYHEPECPPEEEVHVAGLNRETLTRYEDRMGFIFGRNWKEEDRYVRIMQAEMISFFITQLKRKNRKVVTLSAHLARFTDNVPELVGRRLIGIEPV